MNQSLRLRRRSEPAAGPRPLLRWLRLAWIALLCAGTTLAAQAQTALADRPLFATTSVPGNLVLALSVEFPTAVTAADRSTTYSSTTKYLGYFDPLKCYDYQYNSGNNGASYFQPVSAAPASTCSSHWSGNFLNWATMQAVDPFRWALTGGYRAVDSATQTILEKAWAPNGQGNSSSNFPNKSLTDSTTISQATPFNASNLNMHVVQCGNTMVFSVNNGLGGDGCPGSTPWTGSTPDANTTYSIVVRVQVCVSGKLEANCQPYGSNNKPEGLIQKYAQKIRYSAFGYLNDPAYSTQRDGGVLRARMKYVGPTQPVPGSAAITNTTGATAGQTTSAEWDASTGIFIANPDTADASASSEAGAAVSSSGVINYLNQFGLASKQYKTYDPVSELYYASTRYLRNLGNVPIYSDLSTYNNNTSAVNDRAVMKDGFPVITNWTDPILYSCQKNFVLGIGDTNTWNDKDLPGNSTYRSGEPSAPAEITSDPIDVLDATTKVGVMEGIPNLANASTYDSSAASSAAYMGGLAYLFNTTDIRSDLPGRQTISTYWLDVLEGGDYKGGTRRNQFYLAAKYGGFTVPSGYSYANNTTALAPSLWSTNGDTIPIPNSGGPRPDNYFLANQADKMVSGLSSAFANIVATSAAYTTSISGSLPQVASVNNASFSSQFDPTNWTGEMTGSALTFDANFVPTVVVPAKWTFSSRLATQIGGTGWDTGRRVVSWNGTAGVAFRVASLAAADVSALDTSYVAGNDSADYLNYLRGDTSNEAACTTCGSHAHAYRTRGKLVGDIVGSKASPVGPPAFPFSDSTNPGYSSFKSTWATRRTMVYVGANDGMMHAINGALVPANMSSTGLEADDNYGTEMFAYVPRALFQGPNGTPNTDGLASLGNPSFVHHYMVNATPGVYDIDLARTPDSSGHAVTGTPTPNWRSVLIGGLGKGGRSYYAIDVTDPVGMSSNESSVAAKVMWEFNSTSAGVGGALGYSFGEPVVIKTKKYGWVVVFTSGYDNSDGKGYFLFVNPSTGVLLEKVSTGVGSTTSDAGLAHPNAFIVDSSDGTADSIYAGDLLGNLWRLDLTPTSGSYAAPVKIAQLTDASSAHNPQPVTVRPSVEVHPVTKKRFVMVGTGRLLDDSDISSTQGQTFYVIADGTNAAFSSTGTPSAFPYTRSVFANDTNALVGVTFDPNTQAGWYEELGTDSTTGIAYRVTSDATTVSGQVAYSATVPNGQVCNPSGSSHVYARDYATAVTTVNVLVSGTLTPVLNVTMSGTVTDLRFLSVGGKAVLVAGSDTGVVTKVETTPLKPNALRRLNWRELRVVD